MSGRPWWYDSYYEKGKPNRKRIRFPRGKVLTWVVLLLVVALITWMKAKI